MAAWEDDWELPEVRPTQTRPRATLFLLAFLCSGFLLSGKLAETLRLEASAVFDSLQFHRILTYAWVFDTEGAAEFGVIYFVVMALLFFGFSCNLERRIGGFKVFCIFIGGPMIGAVGILGYQFATGDPRPVSGDMLPGAAAVILLAGIAEPGRRVRTFFFLPMRQLLAALCSVALVVAYTLAVYGSMVPLVPLAGAMVAGWITLVARPVFDVSSRALTRRMARARQDRDVEMRREVDHILAKIHETGMESLTRGELRTLKRASRLLAETRDRRG